MIKFKNYWCENNLTTIRNKLDYKLLYIANKASLNYVKEYLSYFGEHTVDKKIKEYIDNGYLKIATNDDKLSFLTIADLKKILKANSLKVSGKKSELIDRIKNNIPNNKYQCYLPIEGYIMRTDRGDEKYHELLEAKDVVLYDTFEKIAGFIYKSDYHSAEKLSEKFYRSNHFKYKSIDWNGRIHVIYPPKFEKQFISEYGKPIYSAIVANDYLGGTVNIEIINAYIKKYENRELNNQTWHTLRAYHGNLRELYLLSKENIKYYSISASNDDQTCIHCKGMDEKKFRVSDAIRGVNFPPFCECCRCTILPVIPNPTHNKYFSYMHKK